MGKFFNEFTLTVSYFVRTLVFTIAFTSLSAQSAERTPCNSHWFTIFVHGTFGLRHNVSLNTIGQLWRDQIDNTPYKAKVETARQDSYFYLLQPIQERGLKKICLDGSAYRGPEIFACAYDAIARENLTSEQAHYFTFGWSGLLSAKQRLLESHDLYCQLKQEREKFKTKTGYYPKIRLIGYSHGGNLCLNLGNVRKEHPEDSFLIDNLILLGTPVQDTTRHLIHEPIFDKIYHLYSVGDMLQRIDIFSPRNLFSHKKFKGNDECPLPRKLTQIRIYISEKSQKTECQTRRRRSKAPGHIELWFFGWTPALYRKSFPFYPLPFAVFIPYILAIVNKHMPAEQTISLQIKPDCNALYLKSKVHEKITIPFMPCKQLQDLRNKALSMHPHYFFTQDRVISRAFDPKQAATDPCSFAELVKEVYPQVQKKNYNEKTVNYFLRCGAAAKNNA